MDKTDTDYSSSSGIRFGEYNVCRLLFPDDLSLLNSNESNLQYALDQFSDACLDAGMKISMAKTEIMGLSRLPSSFFPNKWRSLSILGVTFLCDGRHDNKLDTHIGKASAVICLLYQSLALKQEFCTKAKLSVFRSIFLPILTHGHEC